MSDSKTIFIIDDHERLRKQIANFLLNELNVTILATAGSAEEALENLETWPDLFLVDVSLPGMNGLDLIKELCYRNPFVKCLVLTGNSDIIYKRIAKARGAKGLVEKSEIDKLSTAVLTILDGKEYWY